MSNVNRAAHSFVDDSQKHEMSGALAPATSSSQGTSRAADHIPAENPGAAVRTSAPTRVVAVQPPLRAWLGGLALVAAVTGLLFATHHGLSGPHDQFDLRIYFAAMHWWGDGNALYAYGRYDPVMGILGFTYPPFAALLMSPMAVLGWRTVQVLTVAAIVGAAAVTVHLVLAERFRIARDRLLPVVAGATLASFLLLPIRQTLQFGQVNLFLAVLVLFDLLVLSRRGSRLAGVGVGLAMAIKIVPGIFLLYLVLARQWRAAITGAATCAAAWLLSAVVAPAASWAYFTSLLWDTRRVGILASPSNQSVDGLLARIIAPDQPGRLLFLAAVLLVVLPAAGRIRAAVVRGDTLAAVTITGLLGVLLSPVSWLHHCVWVLPVMVIIVHRAAPAIRGLSVQLLRTGLGGVLHDPVARPAVRRLAGVIALGLTGLAVFVTDTRALLDLPMTNLADLSPAEILGSSVQALWMLAAVFLLPLLPARSADGSVDRSADGSVGRSADGSVGGSVDRSDDGSVVGSADRAGAA
jgi:alpha-1,2-mannosyltransferase